MVTWKKGMAIKKNDVLVHKYYLQTIYKFFIICTIVSGDFQHKSILQSQRPLSSGLGNKSWSSLLPNGFVNNIAVFVMTPYDQYHRC